MRTTNKGLKRTESNHVGTATANQRSAKVLEKPLRCGSIHFDFVSWQYLPRFGGESFVVAEDVETQGELEREKDR